MLYTWDHFVYSRNLSYYLRIELWPDYVEAFTALATASEPGPFRSSNRLLLSAIDRVHWASWQQIDLDGHAPDGTYVIISCHGTKEELETFAGKLKEAAPAIVIDESQKRDLFDYQSRGMLVMALAAALLMAAMWVLCRLAYGPNWPG